MIANKSVSGSMVGTAVHGRYAESNVDCGNLGPSVITSSGATPLFDKSSPRQYMFVTIDLNRYGLDMKSCARCILVALESVIYRKYDEGWPPGSQNDGL